MSSDRPHDQNIPMDLDDLGDCGRPPWRKFGFPDFRRVSRVPLIILILFMAVMFVIAGINSLPCNWRESSFDPRPVDASGSLPYFLLAVVNLLIAIPFAVRTNRILVLLARIVLFFQGVLLTLVILGGSISSAVNGHGADFFVAFLFSGICLVIPVLSIFAQAPSAVLPPEGEEF